MVYEYKVYCDTCCKFAYLDGFIGHLDLGKIYHQHDTFIAFMMEHGGHDIVILGQSADDLKREDYSEFQTPSLTADHAQLNENLVDSQSDSATNSQEERR